MRNPFRCFNNSPVVIRLAVMMYVCYPLSLCQVEYLLFERDIDISHESLRFWWNRFELMFAAEIRKSAYAAARILYGIGTSMRSWFGLMASNIISGALSITKARSSIFSP